MEANSIGTTQQSITTRRRSINIANTSSLNQSQNLHHHHHQKLIKSDLRRQNKKCISCEGPKNDIQEISNQQQKRCSGLLDRICALQLNILSTHLVGQYDTVVRSYSDSDDLVNNDLTSTTTTTSTTNFSTKPPPTLPPSATSPFLIGTSSNPKLENNTDTYNGNTSQPSCWKEENNYINTNKNTNDLSLLHQMISKVDNESHNIIDRSSSTSFLNHNTNNNNNNNNYYKKQDGGAENNYENLNHNNNSINIHNNAKRKQDNIIIKDNNNSQQQQLIPLQNSNVLPNEQNSQKLLTLDQQQQKQIIEGVSCQQINQRLGDVYNYNNNNNNNNNNRNKDQQKEKNVESKGDFISNSSSIISKRDIVSRRRRQENEDDDDLSCDSDSSSNIQNNSNTKCKYSKEPSISFYFNNVVSDEVEWLSANLHRAIRQTILLTQECEETDSSCGSNSSDNEQSAPKYNDSLNLRRIQYLPPNESPKYAWAVARSAAITSWLWNHDAIAHVSFRIGQQAEVHKHLKLTKPTFVLDDSPAVTNMNPNPIFESSSSLKNNINYIQIYSSEEVPATDLDKSQKNQLPNGQYSSPRPAISRVDPTTHQNALNLDTICLGISNTGVPSTLPIPNKMDTLVYNGNSKGHTSGEIPIENHIHQADICDKKSKLGGGLEALGIKLKADTDSTCVARRCLPLKPYRPRKVFQLGGVHKMGVQPEKRPSLLCECFGRTELCALCTGRLQKVRTINGVFNDIRDLTTTLEPTYHRSLAINEDIPLRLYIDASIAREGWKKVTKTPHRETLIKTMPSETTSTTRLSESSENLKKKRGRPKRNNSLSSLHNTPKRSYDKQNLEKIRRASTGARNLGGKSPYKRRKFNSISAMLDDESDETEDEEDDYDYLYENGIPDSPSGKYPRRNSSGLMQDGYRRKRDEKYDIDNIVIPYSIAAATRVEKIEYKEIITPSWRIVRNGHTSPGKNGIKQQPKTNGWNDSDIEDLSTEAILARHERSELEEHRKFSTKDKKLNRRGRRIDSKTDFYDPMTPDAMSPSSDRPENFLISPRSKSPSSFLDRMDTSSPLPASPAGSISGSGTGVVSAAEATLAVSALKVSSIYPTRRRTASAISEESDSQSDDGMEPWEKRTFPLNENEYQQMLSEMPEEYLKLDEEPPPLPSSKGDLHNS